VRRHLEHCPGCQGEFTRFEKTLRMLHSVEEVEVPEGFLSGVYEKIEGRRERAFSPEKNPREGYGLKWKIPAQAFAMVAIVFLALYLTKMTSNESVPMKVTRESKPSVEGGKGPAEIKTPTVKEQKSDREAPYKGVEKAARSEVSNRPKEEAPSEKAENKSEVDTTGTLSFRRSVPQPAAAPSPEKKVGALKEDPLKREKAKMMDERADRELKGMPHSELAPPGATGAPRPAMPAARAREKTAIAKEEAAMAKKTASPEPIPSREFIIRSSDQKKSISELHELVKRFGGETLTTEENTLLISLPRSVLPEFEKDLEGIGAQAKVRQVGRPEAEMKGGVGSGKVMKRGGEEKDKKIEGLDAIQETRAVIRIVLVEE
jgi:hypothetical protein